jgi:septum formation protein
MLILASQSPRRKEILETAGIPFQVKVANVDESVHSGEAPNSYVRRVAAAKAMAVPREPGDVILAADTTVVAAGQILGKPEDANDAKRMLRLLSGEFHEVLTGICIFSGTKLQIDAESTLVYFSKLSEEEIESYVHSGEPMDKAGGYAIQGLASKYIQRVEGCYFNVVGLPISLVYRHLKAVGVTKPITPECGPPTLPCGLP